MNHVADRMATHWNTWLTRKLVLWKMSLNWSRLTMLDGQLMEICPLLVPPTPTHCTHIHKLMSVHD